MTEHPTPWRVEYNRRFPEWHEKSLPFIVDANGIAIVKMPQHNWHPGLYDELADKTAHQIVTAVNGQALQDAWAKQVFENSLNPTVPTPRKPVIND